MATSPSQVAWDSCTWIAHVQGERILGPDGKTVVEDRGAICRPVLDAAERGVIEIVVSAIALVEVLARDRTSGIDDQRVRDFFDNDYILLVNVDKWGRSPVEKSRSAGSGDSEGGATHSYPAVNNR
jgi:hypothetical protein